MAHRCQICNIFSQKIGGWLEKIVHVQYIFSLLFLYLRLEKSKERYKWPKPVVTSYNWTGLTNVGSWAGASWTSTFVYASYIKGRNTVFYTCYLLQIITTHLLHNNKTKYSKIQSRRLCIMLILVFICSKNQKLFGKFSAKTPNSV